MAVKSTSAQPRHQRCGQCSEAEELSNARANTHDSFDSFRRFDVMSKRTGASRVHREDFLGPKLDQLGPVLG